MSEEIDYEKIYELGIVAEPFYAMQPDGQVFCWQMEPVIMGGSWYGKTWGYIPCADQIVNKPSDWKTSLRKRSDESKAHLIEACEKLVHWVEGTPRHSHEEVRDHNGRLKDTKIWVNFYLAVKRHTEIQSRLGTLETELAEAKREADDWKMKYHGLPTKSEFDMLTAIEKEREVFRQWKAIAERLAVGLEHALNDYPVEMVFWEPVRKALADFDALRKEGE